MLESAKQRGHLKAALQPSAGDIRAELNAIGAHKRFARSDRMCQFLRFIVEQKLAGNNVNEQLIAINVFGRSAGFDSGNDTIVRTQAVDLRKRLEEYYQATPDARVRISVPKGGYNPTFVWVDPINVNGSGNASQIAPPPDTPQTIPVNADAPAIPALEPTPLRRQPRSGLDWKIPTAATLLLVASAIAMFFWHSRPPARLSGNHTVVLADFANSTGERVFDGTLKQALTIQLEQSPFLNVLSDSKIAATLKLMNRPANERLTQQIAREICERTNSNAAIEASIANVGTPYLIAIKAVNCESGETLASAEVTAKNRDLVLNGLKTAAIQLRQKLGESLASIQKFNNPLDTVTTSSLDALKAYSEGARLIKEGGEGDGIPYFQRSVELDPNFAGAYLALGTFYANSGEIGLAQTNLRRAFELRDRVTQHERLIIMATYYLVVTGELEKSLAISRQWARTYPKDVIAHIDLSAEYGLMGDYEKAAAEGEEAIRIDPDNFKDYGDPFGDYLALNRLDKAKALLEQAQARGLDAALAFPEYTLALLEGNEAKAREKLSVAKGQRWIEDAVLSSASDTEAYHGRLTNARELSAEAVDAAERNGARESAAMWKVNEALREAEFGNAARARQNARAAMGAGGNRDVDALAALALARAGDSAQADKILKRLDAQFPLNSLLQRYWFPTVRAAMELNRGNAAAAIQALEGKTAYELGCPEPFNLGPMYPVYVRGLAFLKAKQPQRAAGQFKNILVHRGIVLNFPIGALAHVQLARALAMSGDTAGARDEYQNFFALWRDADSDIPILQSARLECARLP